MEEYIDLGLPSGTLWKNSNEDGIFYKYDEAIAKFSHNHLPTKEQFEELKGSCQWEWMGNGYKVIGPNGKSVFMPAEGSKNNEDSVFGIGLCGIYWSSTPNGYTNASELYFDSDKVGIGNSNRRSYYHSVRLVTKQISEINIVEDTLEALKKQGWVDLGLLSGTLWKNDNEKGGIYNDGLYKYNEAIEKYDSYLPTKEQFDELKSSCQWEKVENNYKVIGPNGEYIILNTTGHRYSSGGGNTDIYTDGYYWSSTPDDTDGVWSLRNDNFFACSRLWFQAVRLVIQSVEARKAAEFQRAKEAKRAKSRKYVDLGLPSGTTWKKDNERDKAHQEGFYEFDEARAKFGNQLPTEEQCAELINFCQWEWLGDGYKVTGPNGKSIILPAAGGVNIFSYGRSGVGWYGYYWSYIKTVFMFFSKGSNSKKTQSGLSSFRISVRLVARKSDEEHSADVIQEEENESRQFIDLGLKSGTLWKIRNEKGGLCTYDIAKARLRFENKLPTKEQFEELKSSCQWEWTGDGYKVTGPNGNSIFMPAEGRINSFDDLFGVGTLGCYWSVEMVWKEYAHSSYMASDDFYALWFDLHKVHIPCFYRKENMSLRLVRQSEEAVKAYKTLKEEEARKAELLQYVDLGLPSGTLWKDRNEQGIFYSYQKAKEIFGNKLPTKEQLEELQNICKWTWEDNGYNIEGPNGNKIFMPANGWRNIYTCIFGKGSFGHYWSSSPNNFGSAWILEFNSRKVGFYDNKGRNLEYSVRLIR